MTRDKAVAGGDRRIAPEETLADDKCTDVFVSGEKVGAARRCSGRHATLAAGLVLFNATALAQQSPSLPQGSLVIDPQQGATPRPLQPSPPLPRPPAGTPPEPRPGPAIERSILPPPAILPLSPRSAPDAGPPDPPHPSAPRRARLLLAGCRYPAAIR